MKQIKDQSQINQNKNTDKANQTKTQIKSTNEVSEKFKFANFCDFSRYFKITVLN